MKTYTPEEQKANRKTWIEALRSGKYKQSFGYLENENGFCCLGVLCHIANVPRETKSGTYAIPGVQNYDGQINTAPQSAMDFVGLRRDGGNFDTDLGYAYHSLWELNDSGGFDFNKIADIIEDEPEGLFYK